MMAVSSSDVVTSEFASAARDACRFWVAEGHAFTREEREGALAQYARPASLVLHRLAPTAANANCVPRAPALVNCFRRQR